MMFFANGSLLRFFLLLVLMLKIHETRVSSVSAINSYISFHQDKTDISVGSYLSANAANSWSSPSGRFSFGFYQEPESQGFSLGIQLIVNSSKSMVVWKAMGDQNHFSKEARLTFTADGFFVALGGGNATFSILTFGLPASSAAMLDNGNFVIYTSNSTAYNSSNIIWRSFDHPIDTILGTQSLHCGYSLKTFFATAALKNLLMMQCDGNLVLYSYNSGAKTTASGTETWTSGTSDENYKSLYLDADGWLYLSSPGGYQKVLSSNMYMYSGEMIYAAKLDSDGIFRLYTVNPNANKLVAVNEILHPNNSCQARDVCGIDSFCSLNHGKQGCLCLPGFDYIDKNKSAAGCNRKLRLSRSGVGNFSMSKVENIVGLDDLAYFVSSASDMNQCSTNCSSDYNCYAAFFREQTCFKLKVPLVGGSQDPNNNNTGVAFVKLAVEPEVKAVGDGSGTNKKKARAGVIVIYVVTTCVICLAVIAASGSAYWFLFGRFQVQLKKWEIALTEEVVPRYFSYEELMNDPRNTRKQLGKGSQGTVLMVELPVNGSLMSVAVKWLHGGGGVAEADKDFQIEMSLIGRARHRNLVRLLGFCHDGLNRLLVYEFMPRGSLADHIFNIKSQRPSWARQVGILLGAARGIQYLHHDCETKIIHRDIKPENILIADDWTAKISDFGLAKLMDASQTRVATRTLAAGTDGYVAPECQLQDDSTGAVMLTEKADVYSYGVVVLETVYGKRNRDAKLCELARALHDAGEVGVVLDGEEAKAIWELERVVKIGILCVQQDPEARPSMEEVVMMLEGVMDVPNPPPLWVSRHLL